MAAETKAPASAPEVVKPASDKVDVAPPPALKPADNPAPAPTPEVQELICGQPSFKEETYVANELPELQKKALDELKTLIQEALNNHAFSSPPEEEEKKKNTEEAPEPETATAAEKKPVEEVKKTEEAPAPETATAAEKKPVEEVKKTEEAPVPAKMVVKAEKKPVEEEKKTEQTKKEEKTEQPKTEEKKTEQPQKEEIKTEQPKTEETAVLRPEEVFLWGIPILGDERSDVILLKFLRARDFKVKETLTMIKKCVLWRKEFGVDSLVGEDLGNDYDKAVFIQGSDKEGRPVVYNVFGEFNNKELYQLALSDSEKQSKFLNWLVQFLEKTIRRMDFSPNGISSFVLVNDLKNSPGYGKREFYKIISKFFVMLQDNYPEFVAKQVCLNVSWWYLAYSWVYVSVFTPRSKSKFVFAGSSKAAETLFRYVGPEHVPVQYGGHSRAGELEFTTENSLTEVTIKPSSKHNVEFPFKEGCVFVWELRVVGWECSYEAQFVPEEGYTVLVSKPRKLSSEDEPIICDSFKIGEPGKVVLTIDNHSSKKKKLLYRSKIKASAQAQSQ